MTMAILPAIDTSIKSTTTVSGHPSPPVVDDNDFHSHHDRLAANATMDRLSPPCEGFRDEPSSPHIRSSSPPSHHPASPAPTEEDVGLKCEAQPMIMDTDVVLTTDSQLPTPTTPATAVSPPSIPLGPSEWKTCRQLLISVQRHPSAWPFLRPVDPIAVGAPDYFNIIKKPMDLSTIEGKLVSKAYDSVDAFASDFHLMINNCCTYNPPSHMVHGLAKSLESYTSLQLSKIFPALSADFGAGDRRGKRDVKPPRVFEPEEIPVKKPKASVAARLPVGGQEDGAKKSKKRKAAPKTASTPVTDKISNLFANLDHLQAELAALRGAAKSKKRAASPTPAPKRRRKSKAAVEAEAAISRSPSPSPAMDIDEPALPEPIVEVPIPEVAVAAGPDKACEYCNTTVTPMWRRGPSGKGSLCNKCGVKWRSGRIMGGDGSAPGLPVYEGQPTKPRKYTKKGAQPPPLRPISHFQKLELSNMIDTLNQTHMAAVVEIVRSGMPQYQNTQDEIELTIDSIDPITLAKLYDYVTKACGKGESVLAFAQKARNMGKDGKPKMTAAAKKKAAAAAAAEAALAAKRAEAAVAAASLPKSLADDEDSSGSDGSSSDSGSESD